MTNEQLVEHTKNAHAQAAAAQHVLVALLIALDKSAGQKQLVEAALELASEMNIAASNSMDPLMREHAVRCLEAVEGMRRTVLS